MNTIIEYAKKAKEAYINYLSTQKYDLKICEEINKYINNIENLSKKETNALTEFINANIVNIKHLGDIYVPQNEKYSIRKTFKRIIPMKLSKPLSRIKQVKGDFTNLITNNNKIKIRKKIKFKPNKPVK